MSKKTAWLWLGLLLGILLCPTGLLASTDPADLSDTVPLTDWSYGALERLSDHGYLKTPFPAGKVLTRADLARFTGEALETAQLKSEDEDQPPSPPDAGVVAADLDQVYKLARAYQDDLMALKEDIKSLSDQMVTLKLKEADLEKREQDLSDFWGIRISGDYGVNYQGIKLSGNQQALALTTTPIGMTSPLYNDFIQTLDMNIHFHNDRVDAVLIDRFINSLGGAWGSPTFAYGTPTQSFGIMEIRFDANLDNIYFSGGDQWKKWTPLTLFAADDDDLDPLEAKIFRLYKDYDKEVCHVKDNERFLTNMVSAGTTFRFFNDYDIDVDVMAEPFLDSVGSYSTNGPFSFDNIWYAQNPNVTTQWATQYYFNIPANGAPGLTTTAGAAPTISYQYWTWLLGGKAQSQPLPWLHLGTSIQDLRSIAGTGPPGAANPALGVPAPPYQPWDLYDASGEASVNLHDFVTLSFEGVESGLDSNLRATYTEPTYQAYLTDFAGEGKASFKLPMGAILDWSYRSVGPAYYNPMAQTRVWDPLLQIFNQSNNPYSGEDIANMYNVISYLAPGQMLQGNSTYGGIMMPSIPALGIPGYCMDMTPEELTLPWNKLGYQIQPSYVNYLVPGFTPYSIIYNNLRPYGEATPNRNAYVFNYHGKYYTDKEQSYAYEPFLTVENAVERVATEGPDVNHLSPRSFSDTMLGLRLENKSWLRYTVPIAVQVGLRTEHTTNNPAPDVDPTNQAQVSLTTQILHLGLEVPILKDLVLLGGVQHLTSSGTEYIFGDYPGIATYGIIANEQYNSIGGNLNGLVLTPCFWNIDQQTFGVGLTWKWLRTTTLTLQYMDMIYTDFQNSPASYQASEIFTSLVMHY